MSDLGTEQGERLVDVRFKHGAVLLCFLIFAASALLATGALLKKQAWMKERFLARTSAASLGMNINDLQQLAGQADDLDLPAYHRIKKFLTLIRSDNPDCRFTYLMGLRPDETIFFYADSEPPDSKDYSGPGDVYYEAAPEVYHALKSEVSRVLGPVHDRWGSWVSAYVPLMASQEAGVIAIFGMDIEAGAWMRELFRALYIPGFLMLALMVLALLGIINGRILFQEKTASTLMTRHGHLILLALAGLICTGTLIWWMREDERQSLRSSFERLALSDGYRYVNSIAGEKELYPYDPEVYGKADRRAEIITRVDSLVDRMWRKSLLHYDLDLLVPGGDPEHIVTSCPLGHTLSDMKISHYAEVGGLTFWIALHPSASFFAYHPVRSPWLVASVGLLVTGALLILVMVPLRRRVKLEEMVMERTAALEESESRYEMLALQSLTMTWDLDVNGLYTSISDVVYDLLGYRADELVGRRHFWELCPQEDAGELKAFGLQVLREGRSISRYESRMVAKDGRVLWVRSSGFALRGAKGELIGYRGWDTDFTDLKRAEEEQARLLAESRNREQQMQRLTTAIEQSGDSIVITDVQGRIEYVNPGFERASGYSREEVIGQNPRILKSGAQDADFYQMMWGTILAGKTWTGQLSNRRKDGAIYIEQASIAPVRNPEGVITHLVAIKRDITQEVEREDYIRQTQKMDSIGVLAGGIAHDFNNMLAVIIGNASLLQKKIADKHPELQDEVDEIITAAKRSTDFTQQLLTFARRQPVRPVLVDLNERVGATCGMIRRLVGDGVTVEFNPDKQPATVRIDPSQLDQVVLNLCSNARDAMNGNGRLNLKVFSRLVSRERVAEQNDVEPGDYAVLAIRDTGSGIDPVHLKRIFEPFFTTKPRGKGTGLGLSTVYGIVRQNKGFIDVDSQPGTGTTFEIYLPLEQAVSDQKNEALVHAEEEETSIAGKSILLVEDEVNVLSITSRMLREAGGTVYASTKPVEALAMYKEHAREIDFMITDVVMPEMNGQQLADEIRKINPKLPCLFMSGYAADYIRSQGVREEYSLLQPKPFAAEQLMAAIHKLLHASNRPPHRK